MDKPTTAEREADRLDRRTRKADRIAGWADNAAARSDAAHDKARRMGDAIPLGQPMLTDHYSYKSDRNYRDRMGRAADRSVEEHRKAERLAARSDGIRRWEQERLTVPVTIRRIRTKEAERRKVARMLEPCAGSGRKLKADVEAPDEIRCPGCYNDRPVVDRAIAPHGGPYAMSPEQVARYRAMIEDLDDEIDYWREHVAKLEGDGVKVWGPKDFAKGDRVHVGAYGVQEVVRVNAKTLTVATGYSWTETVPYDKVRGKAEAVPQGVPAP